MQVLVAGTCKVRRPMVASSHATWIRDSTARNLRCVHQSSMGFLVPLARRTQDPVSRENNSANRR